jgi:hypothetical protein
MRGTRLRTAISVLSGLMVLLVCAARRPAYAQSPAGRPMALYMDPRTGAIYASPGRGRTYLGNFVPAGTADQIERRVTEKTQAQIDAEKAQLEQQFAAQQAQQQQWNAEMAKSVSDMQPAWHEFGDRWYKKISIGTLVYAYYGYWTHTGFGPQFLDANQQWPGEGNNGYNEFAINRTYLDFRFTPNDDLMMRITPDMYANIGTPQPDKVGSSTAWPSNSDGNLNLRLKYAYLDYNTFFKKILQFAPMANDKITFGQQPNPLVDWEENLWGFRYTTLTPWNYLSLSSSQVGFAIKGPVKFNEKQYADYDVGVYDDASYHAVEQSEYKQVMGRLTINPLGANSRYDSLGLTGFFDYGYPNKAADGQVGAGNASAYGHMTRIAGLIHYTAETWGLIGEFDYGHNAFSENNLFSGSGPIDAFSSSFTPTSITCSTITKLPTTPSCKFVFPSSSFANMAKVASVYQGASTSVQLGYDFLGHVDIPHTPFTAFGLYQQFLPNDQVTKNPFDFYRFDLGVQWLINRNLRVAIDDQNLTYYHNQMNVTGARYLSDFAITSPTFIAKDVVPTGTNAVFVNLEFKY